MSVRKAVIPAAGLGTRLLPATKAIPKEMMPLLDRPAIQRVVEEAVDVGIRDILIVTSRNKEALADHFDRSPELESALEDKGKSAAAEAVRRLSDLARIHFVRQPEPLGLGHAVSMARDHIGDESFAVLLPDDVMTSPRALRSMLALHERGGRTVLALLRVSREEIAALGAADAEEIAERIHRVRSVVEKPRPEEAPSELAVIGRYVFSPEIFDALDRTPPGVGGEIQLTDAIGLLTREGEVLGWEVEVERHDCGNKLGYLKAFVSFALQDPEVAEPFVAWMRERLPGAGPDEST